MLCIYIISYTFLFFFLTHVPGRLAIMLRVYCVKIVSASVHTSVVPVYTCLSLLSARVLHGSGSSRSRYMCIRVICVLLSCACAVTHRCKLHYTLYGSRST